VFIQTVHLSLIRRAIREGRRNGYDTEYVRSARSQGAVLRRARNVAARSNSKREGDEDTKSFTNYRYDESGSCFQMHGGTLRKVHV